MGRRLAARVVRRRVGIGRLVGHVARIVADSQGARRELGILIHKSQGIGRTKGFRLPKQLAIGIEFRCYVVIAVGAIFARDAASHVDIPGGVDSHCHIEQLAASGLMNADSFETATVSAAMGGRFAELATEFSEAIEKLGPHPVAGRRRGTTLELGIPGEQVGAPAQRPHAHHPEVKS